MTIYLFIGLELNVYVCFIYFLFYKYSFCGHFVKLFLHPERGSRGMAWRKWGCCLIVCVLWILMFFAPFSKLANAKKNAKISHARVSYPKTFFRKSNEWSCISCVWLVLRIENLSSWRCPTMVNPRDPAVHHPLRLLIPPLEVKLLFFNFVVPLDVVRNVIRWSCTFSGRLTWAHLNYNAKSVQTETPQSNPT